MDKARTFGNNLLSYLDLSSAASNLQGRMADYYSGKGNMRCLRRFVMRDHVTRQSIYCRMQRVPCWHACGRW